MLPHIVAFADMKPPAARSEVKGSNTQGNELNGKEASLSSMTLNHSITEIMFTWYVNNILSCSMIYTVQFNKGFAMPEDKPFVKWYPAYDLLL